MTRYLCLLTIFLSAAHAQSVRTFDVVEGNYRVTVKFGDAKRASDTSVRAELRRLMIENLRAEPGQFVTRSFLVNVRRPAIAGGGEVRLTDREKSTEARAWDDKLTLEFSGDHPAVASVEIERAEVPTLFLMGDSTVCDQPTEPYNSWGQMITRFFKPVIAVSNQAESGESIAGALAKGRFAKIWGDMKRGDYLFVQFGHNDMKSTVADALERYTDDLRRVVDETRKRGGIPVLLTPVSRRSFDEAGKIVNSFRGYPDAVKQVAREKTVPLIDLQAMGAAFYEALGPDGSHQAFANAGENTHHGDYGSYQIAKCVLQGIRDLELPLAAMIVDEFRGYDPRHPDPAPWHSMFDGKTLQGWKDTPFAGGGKARVEDGAIILTPGAGPLTGINFTGDFPKGHYELRLEAARIQGGDFFAGITFPVFPNFVSWINGGWNGTVVGLSSLDGYDASENETSTRHEFEKGRWYKLRLRVTSEGIAAWIDDERVVDFALGSRELGLRAGEIELSKPFGIAAYRTMAGLRKIEYRVLE
jgi:lysophospholipase L1-like esterase